jgi:SAM-dependent methyltransferase
MSSERAAREGDLDWEALAPFWHHFEERGFSTPALSLIEGGLVAPCLYVGAGRGTFATRLADRLGAGLLVALERAPAMVRHRVRHGRARWVRGDVRSLPVRDGGFASALVVTGVLEALGESDRVQALGEVARAVAAGGFAVVALSVGGAADPDTWSQLDAWRQAPPGSPAWAAYDAVARDLGDRQAAYRLLRASLPRQEPRISAESLAACGRRAGLLPVARLEVGPDLALFRMTHAPAAVDELAGKGA